MNLTGANQPERLEFVVTHPNYFSMLGATPANWTVIWSPGCRARLRSGSGDQRWPVAPLLWRRSQRSGPHPPSRQRSRTRLSAFFLPDFAIPDRRVSGNMELWLTAGFSADPAPKRGPQTRGFARGDRTSQAGSHAASKLRPGSLPWLPKYAAIFPPIIPRRPDGRLRFNRCRSPWWAMSGRCCWS